MARTYEDLLQKVNGFGTYQTYVIFLVSVPQILNAITSFIPNFILAEHKHRCRVPWSESDVYGKNISESYNVTKCTYTHNSTTYHCTSWVYDQTVYTESMISTFDMVCDKKFYRSHLMVAHYIGLFVGSFVGSLCADIFGRKPSFCIGGLVMFVSNVTLPFATSFYLVFFLKFLNGLSGVMQYISGFVLVTELVEPKRRMAVAFCVSGFFVVGLYVMDLMAFLLRDWHDLVLYTSIPLCIYILHIFMLPESPRWLVVKGRTKQAMAIFKTMSKVNKSDVISCADVSQILIQKDNPSFLKSLKTVAYSRTLVFRILILSFNWAAVNMTYYGISMNVGKLGGDVYLNVFISATVGLIGEIIGTLVSDKIGRKKLYTIMMIVGGVTCFSTIFTSLFGNEEIRWLTIALAMIGRLTSSGTFLIIYLYTTELAPTVLRGVFVSICSCLGRFGSISSSYIGDLGILIDTKFGRALPLIIFGCVGISAGLLCLFLPETLDKSLPDTTKDAEDINREKPGMNGREDRITNSNVI